jgi:hypothetical protein
LEVLPHEGATAIATYGIEPHLVDPRGRSADNRAGHFTKQQALLTVETRDVNGKRGQPGTGFLVAGTAEFVTAGQDFERVKAKFAWARAAVKVTVASVSQTL